MSENIGKVVQVMGPVLDIRFEEGQLPKLLNAIEIRQDGKTLTLDEIPMDDTKYYARKVLEAYVIYQQHHY